MSWVPPSLRVSGDTQLIDFVEGLGPAQVVGRQVLGTSIIYHIIFSEFVLIFLRSSLHPNQLGMVYHIFLSFQNIE